MRWANVQEQVWAYSNHELPRTIRVVLVPKVVYDTRVEAKLKQVVSHIFAIGKVLGFVHKPSVRIIRIPPTVWLCRLSRACKNQSINSY